MPKIEVYAKELFKYCEKSYSEDDLIQVLTTAKAELDESYPEEGTFKIELNDTNRPDLWSTAGLGRQLRIKEGGDIPKYDFFSREGDIKDTGDRKIVVDPGLKDIRPYVTAFAVKGAAIDDIMLKDIIQTQEKLCWNFGRKRKSIAMGVYRSNMIKFPIQYTAADPDKTSFVPLQMDKKLNLREIIKEHPKGQEFGHIVENLPKFPFLTDADGEVLSFPPVINSDRIGAVEVGDNELFIELTGTELPPLVLAASMVACDFADAGYEILPVKVEYPYDTPFGKEVVTPYFFQEDVSVELDYVNKMLGEEFSADETVTFINNMGVPAKATGNTITITPPEYRNDFLHAVDIVEDVMIGRGLNTFAPIMPDDYTMGRLTDEELFSRKVKDILVGLGFQEMIYNYLGSRKDFIEKMNIEDWPIVQIDNPMTENYEFVRNSVLPCLMSSESISGHAVYPHNIFEIGKVALVDHNDNYGSVTKNFLGFMTADSEGGFNLVNSQVSAIFYYLSKEYTLVEVEDPRFITGRVAQIMYNGEKAGVFGEVNPVVLDNWGIQMPCTLCELDLDVLIKS